MRRAASFKEQADLDDAFLSAIESAATADEVLTAFRALEPTLDPDGKKLGLACLTVGQYLDAFVFDDRDKTLEFALRALKILDKDSEDDVASVAMAHFLVGSLTHKSKRFSDSLGFLSRANEILTSLERADSVDFNIRDAHDVNLQLANTKTAMGRGEEAIVHLRKCLELKEKILELNEKIFHPNSKEVGVAYRDLAEAYAAILNFKEALPLCQKALEIHRVRLGLGMGMNSVEVAHDRRVLGVIYAGLNEHDKALEQNELSRMVLENWGLGSDLLHPKINVVNSHIALGKYDEAIETLEKVVQQTDKDSETKALVFILMAKALCSQQKSADVKRCLEVSCGILEKKEQVSPSRVAEAYTEISMLYEQMNESETAISLLKRSLSMLERIPQEQHMQGNVTAKIGFMFLLTGKVTEAVTYMESAAKRMKENFGPKHSEVGHIYNNLGAAYMQLGRKHMGAKMFAQAKDIMDVGLGPNHANTIPICQSLAEAYNALGKYDESIEILKKVVQQTDKDSQRQALVFISMARAFCNQQKSADAKRCLKVSCGILEKMEQVSPSRVAEAYTEISMLYEQMNEFETAISLLKRSLTVLERVPLEQHMEGNVSAKIGFLLLLTGKVAEAVTYLERAVERMKENFGPKHSEVGCIYNSLGDAYMQLDRPQTAVQMFALAKDVMDVVLGPRHAYTIQICQSLANAYSAMRSQS